MKTIFKNHIAIILLIVVFAIILRLININNNSLYGDELTITLDAYSLLKTGQDQLGNLLPLTFPMGAGRPAGYVYGSIPFITLFGPTAFGVRALSILSGIGIIILLYLLGKKLFSFKIGFLAALTGAVSPWDIQMSRGGFEAHFALFLALLGTYFYILAKQRGFFYLAAAVSFGLTWHTYPTYKISLLLFLPLLIWFGGKIKDSLKNKYFLLGGVILIAFGVLALSQTFIGGSEERFSDINIFSQNKDSILQKINLERQISEVPKNLSKYFHNKPVEYTKVFVENYLQNFSLDFLVLHGDRNPRHNMATMGELYFIELALIFIGLISFWREQKKIVMFLVSWVLLAPVSSALVDLPHALRSSFMLPPFLILSALGLSVILKLKSKIALFAVLLFFAIQFIFFTQKLYFLAPYEYSNFWSYPAKLASAIALREKTNFDYIILSDSIDNIEYAYPVYAKVDPSLVILQNKDRVVLGKTKFKQLDNIYIGSITKSEAEKFIEELPGSVLYLGSLDEVKSQQNFQRIIGLDGTEVLVLKRKQL